MYNTAVDATHNLLYVATSGGNAAGRSIIELPLTITGESMPFKARKRWKHVNIGQHPHVSASGTWKQVT